MKHVVLSLGLLFVTAPAAAQTRPDLVQTGSGARAVGLGYAFTAIADDATAISWNPAGMAQLLLPEASIVINTRAMYPRLSIEDNNLDSHSSSPAFAFSPINFASLVYPLVTPYGTAVVGASYRDVYDWRRSYRYTREYVAGAERATVVDSFERTGGIRGFSVAGAFAPSQRFMAGVSASFLGGRTDSETRFEVTGNTNQNRTETSRSGTADYTGTAVELGTLIRPLESVTLGMRYALPYERTSRTINEGVEAGRATLHVPASMSVGIALALNSSSRLAFDLKHQAWSEARVTDTETGATLPAPDRQDMTSYHLGYEALSDAGTHLKAFRLGAFTRPVILPDAENNKYTGYGGSLGFGWSSSRVSLDTALSYLFYDPHARWVPTASRRFEVQDNEILLTAGLTFYF
jgi:long-chain fatty acid transport protein